MFFKEWPIGEKEVTDLLLALAKSTLRYAIAALCWLLFVWSMTLLVHWFDVPWIHTLEKFFCPLIQASYFRQGSHHSMEMRLLSLGSLSHRNQVRLSWWVLYCPCHLSKVLIVIWHLSFFSDWLESFWQAGATCSRSSLAHARKMTSVLDIWSSSFTTKCSWSRPRVLPHSSWRHDSFLGIKRAFIAHSHRKVYSEIRKEGFNL